MDAVKNFVFPNASSQPDDGVAWWLKYACKAAGILSGIGMVLFLTYTHTRFWWYKILPFRSLDKMFEGRLFVDNKNW